MNIAAVVLAYNSRDYIPACLESLLRVKTASHDLQITVIDNNSSDQSADVVRQKFPRIKLITNTRNLGYAEGNNIGIRDALENKASFIWIINPDVTVDTNCLLHLLAAAEKDRSAGIFGPKIYFSPGHEFHQERYLDSDRGNVLWYAGGNMDWPNLIAAHRGVDQVDKGQYDHDIETDFITGACMFIRNRVINDIGFFDPKYFLYYEENDFCQKAKRHHWKLMYVSQAVAWHINAHSAGVGSSLQDYYIARNRLLFGLRYAPLRTRIALVRESIRLYLSGRPWQRRGVLDYYTGNLGFGSFQAE
ncbi:MAG: Glycosyl transferase family 2 [Candidatus Amesbacteria bacterium GW2011_GWB1_47_19]|nr:MAG: Glycosyl transferase family 2 [Candidatus Amesbacteria bacterium GW2011_GWA1_44_24]KKU31399.1 MAG: Glycosyl transferase family 2 [Candidatus Amesbacteria bacterium GW2011_GWC1_46_24]KKU66949.1 MAG: Glycosyl transferase family 2 [Candidatus Amesbacteria bacterium GW2011_GWB1_47_19]OGD06429.1 MAG: hypothetical protein A2379_02205 [Candidatus Amesbacteria bacterium RIFOXYB1_FULL_47_13]HBC72833.1 hypothetical protein [Candidatus Amesbacteria bacterium]